MKRLLIAATAAGSLMFSPVIFSDVGSSPSGLGGTSQNDMMNQNNMMQGGNTMQDNQPLGDKLKNMSDNHVDLKVKNGDGQEFHATVPKDQANNIKEGDNLTVTKKMDDQMGGNADTTPMGGQLGTDAGTMNDQTDTTGNMDNSSTMNGDVQQ